MPKKERLHSLAKRIIDIVLAIILLIVTAPVCLITAIIIKLTPPAGPILADIPPRVGKNGKLFKLYKFRSMIPHAHELLRRDPRFKKLYEEYKNNSYKLKKDPRVTPIGHFIRKHSIDELPQLINVLKGEMSIVGPRPYYPDELREQQKKHPETKKYVKMMLTVKPGITGLWQVSGRSNVAFTKRIVLDARYARRKSLWDDFIILLKSPWVVITGQGAE